MLCGMILESSGKVNIAGLTCSVEKFFDKWDDCERGENVPLSCRGTMRPMTKAKLRRGDFICVSSSPEQS